MPKHGFARRAEFALKEKTEDALCFELRESPETLAQAWAEGYDQDTTDLDYRKQNARYWYDYFTGPDAPQPIPEPEPEPYTVPQI